MEFTDAELEAYLDESLDSDRAAEVELQLRSDSQLLKRLSRINSRRDAGMHTLGEIWRRNQIGVPNAATMTDYLTGRLSAEAADYIEFRIDELKCPFTIALKSAAEDQLAEADPQRDGTSQTRREKIYKKSAGLLRKKKKD